MLTGTHDFAGFAANRGHPPTSTIRTLREIHLTSRGPLLTLRFTGDGFLYKMVRLLTGTLIRCAAGRMDPGEIDRFLAGGGQPKTHFQAPAEGLYLARVLY
jgi:tRNA pseudouridine38-40 synthase